MVSSIVFFIVGIIVSGVSYYLMEFKGQSGFSFFLYLGFVFMAFALVKGFLLRKKRSGKDVSSRTILYCAKCGVRLHVNDKFCPGCGKRK